MIKQIISLEDYKANKERCPIDGNKIFLEYNIDESIRKKYGVNSMLKCTYCGNRYYFNESEGGYCIKESLI